MEKQLSDLTVVELKAIAYDQMAQIELAQNNLRVVNQELSRRSNINSQNTSQISQNRNPAVDPLPPGSIQSV
jgi:hypothetical protein